MPQTCTTRALHETPLCAFRLFYVLRLRMQTGHEGAAETGAEGAGGHPVRSENLTNRVPVIPEGGTGRAEQELCVQLYLLIYTIINTNVHKSSLYFVLCSRKAAQIPKVKSGNVYMSS